VKPNKTVCVLLSSTMLFCGCYSYSALAKDEPVPDDKDARFQLKDGGLLEAEAGNHSRIERGYQVSGTLVRQDTLHLPGSSGVRKTVRPFTGVIRDADIEEIIAYQPDVVTTVLVVALPVLMVGIVVASSLGGGWGPIL
jgi:hypothetical protein